MTTPCLYCSDVYSKSKAGEGWMKWGECDLWAHKCVHGMNSGRSSVTFVTKTGVAHFTLQFWQLNKTDHFVCVCFAIFLVKVHRNYYIQSIWFSRRPPLVHKTDPPIFALESMFLKRTPTDNNDLAI